jgi:hypothetical protein
LIQFKFVPGEGLKPSLLSRCLYYSQRIVTLPALRGGIAALIARVIRASQGKLCTRTYSQDVGELNRAGFVNLGELLSTQQCADIHVFLRGKALSDRYAEDKLFTLDTVPAAVGMAEYGLADIINCPHILALANSERLLVLAEQYLGCKPTLSSLMLRWSFPTDAPIGNVQRFHRDADDWRYLKIMVYLTDVTVENGPHVYVLGTHRQAAPIRIRIEGDEEIRRRYSKEAVKVVTGTQGTGFAADTAGIHKGEVPREGRRLMLQVQYSLLPGFAYRYCPQQYSGALKFDRYVNRLLVA